MTSFFILSFCNDKIAARGSCADQRGFSVMEGGVLNGVTLWREADVLLSCSEAPASEFRSGAKRLSEKPGFQFGGPKRGLWVPLVPGGLGFFILSDLRKSSRDCTPASSCVLKVTNTVLSVAVDSEN